MEKVLGAVKKKVLTSRRALKLLLPAVAVIEAGLLLSGTLSPKHAALVVAAAEALLLAAGIGKVFLGVRRYRRGRAGGLDGWKALEAGLEALLPRRVARLAATEPRLLVCLARWVFRRAKPLEDEFTYHKKSVMRGLVLIVLFTGPAEVLIFHILAGALLPGPWLKWVILALGTYGALWLCGFYASLATTLHRLEESGLRLRYGAFAEGFVPYDTIESVEWKVRKSPNGRDGLKYLPEEGATYLAVGGRTDLTLGLRTPRAVEGFFKDARPAATVHLAADDPRALRKVLLGKINIPTEPSEGRPTFGNLPEGCK